MGVVVLKEDGSEGITAAQAEGLSALMNDCFDLMIVLRPTLHEPGEVARQDSVFELLCGGCSERLACLLMAVVLCVVLPPLFRKEVGGILIGLRAGVVVEDFRDEVTQERINQGTGAFVSAEGEVVVREILRQQDRADPRAASRGLKRNVMLVDEVLSLVDPEEDGS